MFGKTLGIQDFKPWISNSSDFSLARFSSFRGLTVLYGSTISVPVHRYRRTTHEINSQAQKKSRKPPKGWFIDLPDDACSIQKLPFGWCFPSALPPSVLPALCEKSSHHKRSWQAASSLRKGLSACLLSSIPKSPTFRARMLNSVISHKNCGTVLECTSSKLFEAFAFAFC